MKVLLTGQPHSGKSTAIAEIVRSTEIKQGLLAREMTKLGERSGFECMSSLGQSAVLASVTSQSHVRVGRYGVEPDALNALIEQMPSPRPEQLLYIDEIGQMQLFSTAFKRLVVQWLDTPNTYIGTISAVYSDEFTEHIKQRHDVVLIELTPDNRDEVTAALKALVRALPDSSKLSPNTQKLIDLKAKAYMYEHDFLRLKKLYHNTVRYVAEGRIKLKNPNEWVVTGDHGAYTVRHQAIIWSCECDLFKGQGKYAGRAGECSHISAAALYTALPGDRISRD